MTKIKTLLLNDIFARKAIFFIGFLFYLLLNNIHALLFVAFLLVFYFFVLFKKSPLGTARKAKKVTNLLLFMLIIALILNVLRFLPINFEHFSSVYDLFKLKIYIVILCIGALFVHFQIKEKSHLISYSKGQKNKLTSKDLLALLFVGLLFLFFGFYTWRFVYQGETKWISTVDRQASSDFIEGFDDFSPEVVVKTAVRCESYWNAYYKGNFKATFNNANPNATLCFMHLPAYLAKSHVSYDAYILIVRATILFHNLLFLILVFYFLKIIFSKEKALLAMALLGLSPLFIGYSRFFNHDSIQGLYIINFVLSLWTGLKTKQGKYFFFSGLFFALALLNSFKGQFIVPLLFLLPIVYFYLNNDKTALYTLIYHLRNFFKSAFLAILIILPAALFYPKFIIERFFFYPNVLLASATILVMIAFILTFRFPSFANDFFSGIKKYERYFVRLFLLVLVATIGFMFLKQDYVFNVSFYQYLIGQHSDAFWASWTVFFYSLPPVLLVIFAIWLFAYFKQPKIDFSFVLTFLFFSLFVLLTFMTFSKFTKHGEGYFFVDAKYLFVILPLFIIGLATSCYFDKWLSRNYILVFMLVSFSLAISNYLSLPFLHYYNNFLLPSGRLITNVTSGVDSAMLSSYINENFSNVVIYHPKGILESLVKNDIEIIPWYEEFWRLHPDYVIATADKSHRFTKIFEFYQKNETSILKLEKNGVIYSGLYKFDPNLDYESLLLD